MPKEDYRILSDYNHLFTTQILTAARLSVKNPRVRKPTFMTKVPGVFQNETNGAFSYTDVEGVKRIIVPKEKQQRFLNKLWSIPTVPRGQESFQRFISKRYIGVPARLIRDFVGNQTGIQMIRPLFNIEKIRGRRAVRASAPFKRISFDLADMISFSDVRGQDEPRFVLLLCCDFSGFLFAKLLLNKSGAEVAKKMKSILKKITKLGGKPVIATSDLGKEFLNVHVKNLFKSRNIRHLQPRTARIAPYIENRVRHFKRYARLLSSLLFKDTYWYEPETIKNAVKSVNNIQRESGKSALEIVQMFRKGLSLAGIRKSYLKGEEGEDKHIGFGTLQQGDFVRVRKAKQKLDLKHKSHLGFRGDNFDEPVNWSNTVYRVLKIMRLRVRRTIRIKLDNGFWYNRGELLKVPSDKSFNPDERMPRVNK